jgi:hypothetical protein
VLLQLPRIHLLEVLLVLLTVPLKLGPLGDELAGHRPGALLQLGAPVAEALALGLKCLPLRKIAAPVSLRTWWVRDSMRGRGMGTASSSAPDRSLHPNTTSTSSSAGGGLELDAPSVSPPTSGVGVVSEAGVDPPARASSVTATPPEADAAAAGPPAGA